MKEGRFMKITDEFNTLNEPETIDVWDDYMGWDDIKVDYEDDDRYPCGCCTCCGCSCWIDEV